MEARKRELASFPESVKYFVQNALRVVQEPQETLKPSTEETAAVASEGLAV